MTRVIDGADLLEQRVHADARGALVAFEGTNLPFPLERVFFMNVDDPGAVRGGHANSCDEYIVALRGAVEVGVDNGRERASVRLDRFDQALWVKPGVLIDLRGFAAGTLLLVCASARYADTRHFEQAQPDLILAAPA